MMLEYVKAKTYHVRKGEIKNHLVMALTMYC